MVVGFVVKLVCVIIGKALAAGGAEVFLILGVMDLHLYYNNTIRSLFFDYEVILVCFYIGSVVNLIAWRAKCSRSRCFPPIEEVTLP